MLRAAKVTVGFVVSGFLWATMLLSLSSAADVKGPRIGLASREIVNDVNRDIIAGARKIVEDAGGTLIVADGQSDARKHNENIENLINSHVDGLIIELGDAQQLAPVVTEANKAGIPVATVIVGSPVKGTLTEVGGDQALLGELCSRALLSSINYQGDVYEFWVPGAPLLESTKRILEAMAKDYPKVKLHEVPTEHSAAKVESQMEDILTANPTPGSIAAVWGGYDLLVSGAVQAIQQANRSEIKVASMDGDRVGFKMLAAPNSPFIATVVQDVPRMGGLAAQSVLDALKGRKSFPVTSMTDAWVATRNNVVKAAEMRWGPKVWDDIKMSRADVQARFPQTQDVVVIHPVVPY
jgi:ribose transport system substrate-binding protein